MAMKDVAKLRYASGRCLATFDPEISEWGNPSRLAGHPELDSVKYTRGSETSQYLEEKRPTYISYLVVFVSMSIARCDHGISLVAASEMERAQTQHACMLGVVR